MSINFHPDYPNKRYIVETEMAKGHPVNVYAGNNRAEAVRITNFWDERCNTYFYDLANEGFKGYGTDADAPQYGNNVEQNFANATSYINGAIERKTQEALARIF